RALEALGEDDRAALTGDVAVRTGVERPVGVRRVGRVREAAGPQLAREGGWTARRFDSAGHHGVDAATDRTPRLSERLESACTFCEDDARGPLHPVLDPDLPGGRRVEPRDRLVRADVERAFPPEVLDLP